MQELWKTVEGFDKYEISNMGRVRSWAIPGHANHRRVVPKVLKPITLNNGYLSVSLNNNGVVLAKTIHRLVALHFLDNPEKHPVVAHLDGSRVNNIFTNLLWCTDKENHSHKKQHGTSQVGERNGNSKLSDLDVQDIRASDLPCVFLAKKYGVHRNTIYRLKRLL